MTKTNGIWIIEWNYSPANYFEEQRKLTNEEYEITIKDGHIEARTKQDPRPKLCSQIDKELKLRFQGVMLIEGTPYKLSNPSISYLHSDGKRITYFVGAIEAIGVVNSIDIKITQKDGKIIADTRAERIKRKRSLSDLAAKYGISCSVSAKILDSYYNAINDSDNCLVYLYEIRDALAKYFCNENVACTKLNVAKKRWKELGKLANDEPLKQGRHRGKMTSKLRDATKDELNTAMSIGKEMVEKYLYYLDKTNN